MSFRCRIGLHRRHRRSVGLFQELEWCVECGKNWLVHDDGWRLAHPPCSLHVTLAQLKQEAELLREATEHRTKLQKELDQIRAGGQPVTARYFELKEALADVSDQQNIWHAEIMEQAIAEIEAYPTAERT